MSGHIVEAVSQRVRGDRATTIAPRGEDEAPAFRLANDDASAGLWGAGSRRAMRARGLTGSTEHYTVGADIERDWLLGVGVTRSTGEGRYKQMELTSTLTTVHPYAAWHHDGYSAWATAGHGTGTLDMTDTAHKVDYDGIDLSYRMLGGGVDRALETERIRWNVGAEGFWNAMESKRTAFDKGGHVLGARALNRALEGYVEATYKLSDAVHPSIEWAVVHENDEYGTDTNLRLGAGIDVHGPRLRANIELTRVLAAERSWNLSGSAAYEHGGSGPYAQATLAASQTRAVSTLEGLADPSQAAAGIEIGWRHSNRLSPYVAWGEGAQIGQRLEIDGMHVDMLIGSGREVRMALSMPW